MFSEKICVMFTSVICICGVFTLKIECHGADNCVVHVQCPGHCSCILGNHQVYLICHHIGHNRSVQLHFPSEILFLNISYNGFTAVTSNFLSEVNSLCRLDLSFNAIKVLPDGAFHGLYKLIHLHLNSNFLKSLPEGVFCDLGNLKTLDLGDNLVVSLSRHFSTLFNIWGIVLSNNRISHIAHDTFTNLTTLHWLYLSNNRLAFLSSHIFCDLRNLLYIDLSKNNLVQIPEVDQLTDLTTMDLRGNPLTYVTQKHFDGLSNVETIIVDQPVICVCFLNNSDSCSSTQEQSPYLTCDRLLSATALSVFTWILGICATLSNGFVLMWRQIAQRRQGNEVQPLLLSNLATSDLLMGIYMIIIASADMYYGEYFPMNAEHWRLGVTCKIASMLAITSSQASVFFVTLISGDRFVNIRFPYTIRKLDSKSTKIASFVIWCLSISLALIATITAGKNAKFYDNSHVCIGLPLAQMVSFDTGKYGIIFNGTDSLFRGRDFNGTDSLFRGRGKSTFVQFTEVKKTHTNPGAYYSVAIFAGLNMLCFLLILACYVVIIASVFKTSKEISRQMEMAEEIHMTIKVSALVLTDFCCWFPISLIGVLVQAGVMTVQPSTFAWIVTFILPINSSINPLMYTLGSLIGEKCTKHNSVIPIEMQ